jgi:hypothetical protein
VFWGVSRTSSSTATSKHFQFATAALRHPHFSRRKLAYILYWLNFLYTTYMLYDRFYWSSVVFSERVQPVCLIRWVSWVPWTEPRARTPISTYILSYLQICCYGFGSKQDKIPDFIGLWCKALQFARWLLSPIVALWICKIICAKITNGKFWENALVLSAWMHTSMTKCKLCGLAHWHLSAHICIS